MSFTLEEEYLPRWKDDKSGYHIRYNKEKVCCTDCDKMISRGSLSNHKKSKYHIMYKLLSESKKNIID